MIAEYKLYHGAVLAEIVHRLTVPVTVDELHEEGRLTSYILDSKVGMQIKHSTKRLHPWQFSFTARNVDELTMLRDIFPSVFVVFVCHTAGIVCCSFESFSNEIGLVAEPWIRIDRQRGKWFQLSGPASKEPLKLPSGIDEMLKSLGQPFRLEDPA